MKEGGGPEADDRLSDAARVAGWATLGKIAGFGVIVLMAARFGRVDRTDDYFLAAQIPLAILLFAQTRIPGLVVSLFSEYRYHLGDREAWRFAHAAINASALAGAAAALVGLLASHPIGHLLGPNLDEASRAEVVTYFRWMIPAVVLGGVAGVLRGLLQAHRYFGLPAAEGLVFNVCIGGMILWQGPQLGLMSAVLGVAIGTAARLLLLLPAVIRLGSWEGWWTLYHPGVVRLCILAAPLAAITFGFQLNVLIGRSIATALPPGAVSALNYADRLAGAPLELFVFPLCMVLLPRLVDLRIRRSDEVFGAEVLRGMRLTLLLMFPIAAAFLFLSGPAVRLVYQWGVFLPADAETTGRTLAAFALVFLAAAAHVAEQAYYALQKTWVILLAGGAMVSVNVVAALALIRVWPQPGAIPLAQGLAGLASLAVFLAFLARDCRLLVFKPLLRSLVTAVLGSVWMSVFLYATLIATEQLWPGSGKGESLLQVAVPGAIGFLVYGLVLSLMRAEEIPDLVGLLRRARRPSVEGL